MKVKNFQGNKLRRVLRVRQRRGGSLSIDEQRLVSKSYYPTCFKYRCFFGDVLSEKS